MHSQWNKYINNYSIDGCVLLSPYFNQMYLMNTSAHISFCTKVLEFEEDLYQTLEMQSDDNGQSFLVTCRPILLSLYLNINLNLFLPPFSLFIPYFI